MLAVLRKDLDAVVAAVADEQAAVGVHGKRVRIAEFTVFPAGGSPLHEEVAVGAEFQHPVVAAGAVPVGDEDAAVRRHEHVGWLVEFVFAVPGDTRFAEAHQELAIRAEFMHLVTAAGVVATRISHPDIAVTVDMNPVWPDEQPGAETPDQVAVRIEQEDVVEVVVADAGVLAATLGNPDVAFGRCIDGAGRAPFATDVSPAGFCPVRVRRGDAGSDGQQHAADQDPGFCHDCFPLVDIRNHTAAAGL